MEHPVPISLDGFQFSSGIFADRARFHSYIAVDLEFALEELRVESSFQLLASLSGSSPSAPHPYLPTPSLHHKLGLGHFNLNFDQYTRFTLPT